ncbi:cytochrome-c oxidase, cbb3-type subunit III [uncultured Tateyamaria sp.]|uniref:cytochrome-c oxidase, cbb3-type subunit III n=1 Tax=uncultured Tateyamaria sp. TaxID=455651 RepID=UPI0026229F98|nr:cytochrome-c oxidase, cbb3-type subunit III [uncultured Tateyamaria sp.]
MKPELDEPSGQHTTGHEWDGLKELNTPVPLVFRISLWLTIAVSVITWVLYPSWPGITGYVKGVTGYSSRDRIAEAVADRQILRLEQMPEFASLDVTELANDPTLEAKYSDAIAVLYRDNCSACHGRDLKGQTNFPNLTDDHWLWSGTPEEIEYTLQYGINHTSDDTRWAEMPAFGDGMLERPDIAAVVEYVLKISGSEHDTELANAGAVVFEENCASCHEAGGIGGMEIGAPSLVDDAWIYGGTRDVLTETLKHGRQGVMPGWSGRLTEEEIKKLTLYVLWAGEDGQD